MLIDERPNMRCGTVSFCSPQGLGYLAKSFYDAGIVTDPILIRHSTRENHTEWYKPGTHILSHTRIKEELGSLIASMDVMLFFETPFEWDLIPFCRRIGVKTVLMPMYECMPKVLPHEPDYFICPSLLDLQYYPNRSIFIPVPVDTQEFRLREKAEVFVHNAGHLGLKGRNGTLELLRSIPLVKSPCKFIIRCQKLDRVVQAEIDKVIDDPRVSFSVGNTPREQLYQTGDVFVFPERWNGLSLPLQEAYASGMLVMCGDRFPMNTWLPLNPLIPVEGYKKGWVSGRCQEFDDAIFSPGSIAETIDGWYGKDITQFSLMGKLWAEANNWDTLRPKYLEVLSR